MGEQAIELIGVAKQFSAAEENVQAVERVDLSIGSGEFFSLLGPSGCGKTTTLRMIAGFEEPTQGQILLYGVDQVGVPANNRDLNMVFQSYALFPHMTVFDNVAFGLRRKKLPKAEIAERVNTMFELVDLKGREKRRPREMSGGQQQRVALARALVNRPRALLLDEPLGALDLKLRQSMQLELKRNQREVGITFVYVTHDQGEALTMSDRIAVMNAGHVEQLGSPREVYESPATRFVADFIGTSNLVELTATSTTAGESVADRGAQQRIVVPLRGQQARDRLVVAVRPEKVGLATAPPGADCQLSGRVEEVVYQGTFTAYTVQTAPGEHIVCHWQNATDSSDVAAVGDTVWVSWAKEHSYLLEDPGKVAAAVSAGVPAGVAGGASK
ncbi:MAG: spermidine/putrescine transporter ATPase subunit [Marmoricola sp.]|nr:spermidine/putrescine transporter ATPase subunit [Marmoricola sp.]